jgi:hypothetical protein
MKPRNLPSVSTSTPLPPAGIRPVILSIFSLAVSTAILAGSVYFTVSFAEHPRPLLGRPPAPGFPPPEVTFWDKAIGFGVGAILILGSLRWVARFTKFTVLSVGAYFRKPGVARRAGDR